MNDGSTDKRYVKIKKNFPEITYFKNEINGGRAFYWRTVNTILNEIKKYTTYAVIQIDDDFILCKGFIDKLMNKFFEIKRENNSYMGIRYHIASFKKEDVSEDFFDESKTEHRFDGGSLFDIQFLRMFNYKINEINPKIFNQKFQHSHVWSSLNILLEKFGAKVYMVRESLAWHTGNEDSKMHPEIRKIKKIYTKRFVDDTDSI
jgi:hypothetical protein